MRVAILGFGVEGKDAARYFVQKKAEVTVFDKKQKEELAISDFETLPITWVCGENYLSGGLPNFDIIVRSPGIRPALPAILEAVKNGAQLTSNTKIFFDECKKPIIAVTGTKGKGTTATLIYKALEAAGKKALLAGNIGEPMLSLLNSTADVDFVVLELSSFQTMDLAKSPHIVVVTNITLDHMDWHKNEDEYVNAKAQLWSHQTKDDYLVLNKADRTSRISSESAPGTVIWYYVDSPNKTEYAYTERVGEPSDEELVIINKQYVGSLDFFDLPGKHNVANLLAALSAASCAEADMEKAWQGAISFKGLEHRLEIVATINSVLYVNDSFATNPEPTLAAIASFEQPKIIILGGSSKGANFDAMAQKMVEADVRGVVLIGDEAENIEAALDSAGYKGKKAKGVGTMTEIVQAARDMAEAGDVVLLSPAYASFGLFQNYKDRGKQFKEAVKLLAPNDN